MRPDSIVLKVTRRASCAGRHLDARRQHPSNHRGVSGPTGILIPSNWDDVYSSADGEIGGVRIHTT